MKKPNLYCFKWAIGLLFFMNLSCNNKIAVPEKVAIRVMDMNGSFVANAWYRLGNTERKMIDPSTAIEITPTTGLITFGAGDNYDSVSVQTCGEHCRVSSIEVLLDDSESNLCSVGQRVLGSARKIQDLDVLQYRDGLTISGTWRDVTTNNRLYNDCFLVDNAGFSDIHFLYDRDKGLSMRVKKKKRNSDSQVNVVLVEDGMVGDHCIDWTSSSLHTPSGG